MGEVENRVRGKGVGGEQGESDGNKRKVHLERLCLGLGLFCLSCFLSCNDRFYKQNTVHLFLFSLFPNSFLLSSAEMHFLLSRFATMKNVL